MTIIELEHIVWILPSLIMFLLFMTIARHVNSNSNKTCNDYVYIVIIPLSVIWPAGLLVILLISIVAINDIYLRSSYYKKYKHNVKTIKRKFISILYMLVKERTCLKNKERT